MTDDRIEAKALALANEVLAEWGVLKKAVEVPKNGNAFSRALLRAIEQHEAYKQEVSDAVEQADLLDLYGKAGAYLRLQRFIIPKPKPKPKPDPLLGIVEWLGGPVWGTREEYVKEIHAALEARGLTITTKEKD